MQPFVKKVDMKSDSGMSAFIAEYDQRGEKTMLIGQITEGATLQVWMFTLFEDNSSRSDHWAEEEFRH